MKPDPKQHCGPYKQQTKVYKQKINDYVRVKMDRYNHDTIGMVAIDNNGDIAAGTSTNGAKFKISG